MTALTSPDALRFNEQPADPRQGVTFLKGHGTENDFVLIPDRTGQVEISDAQVRALCDRRAGIGGDGLIRIAPADAGPGFQMDYRNADGSFAEMCGNGARVFAKFLYDAGWVESGPFSFVTRGGRRTARPASDGLIWIEMGAAVVGAPATTTARLTDGSWRAFSGLSVNVGNPHLVAFVDLDLDTFDLDVAPTFDRGQFPDGVNIEFVQVSSADAVSMRVFERGVGETRSCGTGTVAVAATQLHRLGRSGGDVSVTVPGGVVSVGITAGDSSLTGPAVIVAGGLLDRGWWSEQGK